ncbi:helix-turn-helix domain-containing protein [Herbaspirillum sp. WKF16]|uniref:helix-turn-helix transcriptional regulator n=1 Tax=Herbaspirillum sp. WKF16 TaxID=3028312 RepID=UPI0023A92419|nr:helix-turn-helix domain-containing protein [Herbaspirillum sp. WKF16]WDZ94966.1 helix-turn-helix domain-containing protein [Herbaspirillum sp. WKF16]
MNLIEIGSQAKAARQALELTQGQLARLSGLSRTTINHLENGVLKDLGSAKLIALLALLGMRLDALPRSETRGGKALEIAARSAGTSYGQAMSALALKKIFGSGVAPPEFRPHIATLLDEAPLPLVIRAIREASVDSGMPMQQVMGHVADLARQLQVQREVW